MINTEYNKPSASNAKAQEPTEQAEVLITPSLSQKAGEEEHHKSHSKGHHRKTDTSTLQLAFNPSLFQQNVAKLAKKCTELPEYIAKQRQEAKALEDSENMRAELIAIRRNRQISREQDSRDHLLGQNVHLLEIRE